MTRTVVFLLLLTTAAGPGFAITLDEAVEQALRGNPGLEAARAEWQAAETRKTQVTTLPDPTVEFTFGSSGAEYEGELRSIAIGQALPFPAKVLKARSKAKIMELAAGTHYGNVERNLVESVRRAYIDLAVTDEKIGIYRDDLSDAQVLLEAIRQSYEVGRAGQHDLVKAQVEVLLIENRLDVLANDDRVAAAERLKALVGLDRSEALGPVVLPRLDFARVDTAAVRAAGVEGAPELETRAYLADAAGEDVGLARMEWIPDFKLRLFQDERDMAMGRNKARGVMLSANLPLWGWRTRALVNEKNASLVRQRSELEAARDALEARLAAGLASFASRLDSYVLFDKSVIPQAELAYLSAMAAYETGKVDILSVIAAQRTLREAKLTRLDLWAGMAKTLAEMETITGLEFY
jgi:cobalt-zinc-cadmium efflux system outer membrane protein